jgi:uncharacterized protein YidB (DUF937 family)
MTSVGSSTDATWSATAVSGHRHHGHGGGKAAMDAAASALGMSDDDLRSALQSGQTLTQLAQQQGVSTDTLTQAMSSALQKSDSSMSTDQASAIAQRMLAGPAGPPPQQSGGPSDSAAGTAFGQALDAAASELGTTTSQLMSSLGSGESLLDLAGQQGVSSDDLTKTLSSALQKADSSLSANQADQLAERIAQGPPTTPVDGSYDQTFGLAAQYSTIDATS